MTETEALLAARALLADVTPLRTDCGRCCGAACCAPDEDGQGGMLLFPGEEALFRGRAGFRIVANDAVFPGGRLLLCNGTCDRAERPLACRMFPLLPHREKGAVMDRRGWAVCPLMSCGKRGLSAAFVDAVAQAGKKLYACPAHAAFLDALHTFNAQLTLFSR